MDDAPGVSGTHRITAIPTLMIFKNGAMMERMTGLASKASLVEKLTALRSS